jgi:hypothetical protein
VLVKSMLEAIPMYWVSLTFITKGVLNKMRKLSLKFQDPVRRRALLGFLGKELLSLKSGRLGN